MTGQRGMVTGTRDTVVWDLNDNYKIQPRWVSCTNFEVGPLPDRLECNFIIRITRIHRTSCHKSPDPEVKQKP